MFKSKKEVKPRSAGRQNLSQYGLFDIPDDLGLVTNDNNDLSDGDDMDLEAELAALSGGVPKRPKPEHRGIPAANLDAMIAASMKEIPSDEELSGDENDPDLLNELNELTFEESAAQPPMTPRVSRAAPPIPGSAGNSTVELLQARIDNYTEAELNAKTNGENSRARRFGRGLKTLKDLMKQAKAGKTINEDDIPPQVSTGKQGTPAPPSQLEPIEDPVSIDPPHVEEPEKPELLIDLNPDSPPAVPTRTAPSQPTVIDNSQLGMLIGRRDEYKTAALKAKQQGDKMTALSHLKIVKQFERVIEAMNEGQPVDLSQMPPPPVEPANITRPSVHIEVPTETETNQTSSEPVPDEDDALPEESLIGADSVEEALQQRLEIYKQQEANAKEQGNSAKVRRMGRIVKQYQQAIKLHAAGKPIPIEDLPTPPGYAPIPVPGNAKPEPQPSPKPQSRQSEPTPEPPAPRKPQPLPRQDSSTSTTRAEKQLVFLLRRQKEFKEAAIEAKKKGDIEQAKEYLRNAKGFNPLIEASKCGLAVDLGTLPLPPQAKQQLEDTFEVVTVEDDDNNEDSPNELFSRLEEQLRTQLKLCLATRDHNKAMGDVAGTNRFEQLAMSVKQDLDVVKLARRLGKEAPKFHFEMKQFSVVQCCTDLGDNDLELTILRGISYNVTNPKDVDTYVRFEFPYPQEEPVKDKTILVKDTNNPEYNNTYNLTINRTQRACLRVFKRHAIKFEVYSRGCCGWDCSQHLMCFSGLFYRDSLIGTVNVKLQQLETQTVLHDSFDLMDGRKAVGGKLEIKIRIRNPLLTKQIEQTNQKWLIIDHETQM